MRTYTPISLETVSQALRFQADAEDENPYNSLFEAGSLRRWRRAGGHFACDPGDGVWDAWVGNCTMDLEDEWIQALEGDTDESEELPVRAALATEGEEDDEPDTVVSVAVETPEEDPAAALPSHLGMGRARLVTAPWNRRAA
jgi:hypothetical protein